jgi:hypothetical protein
MRRTLPIGVAVALLASLLVSSARSADSSRALRNSGHKAEIVTTDARIGRHYWFRVRVRCVVPRAIEPCKGVAETEVSLGRYAHCICWPMSRAHFYSIRPNGEKTIAFRLVPYARPKKSDGPGRITLWAEFSVNGGRAEREKLRLHWRPRR